MLAVGTSWSELRSELHRRHAKHTDPVTVLDGRARRPLLALRPSVRLATS
jgi:hypothetical protein